MSVGNSLNSGLASALMGATRLAGILCLVILLAPIQSFVLLFRCGDPFFLPTFFHRCALNVLGLKVRVHGTRTENGPVLYVANHASYLDVTVLGSMLRAVFVAKSEVEGWPVFGMLSKLQQTAFIERRAVRAAEQRESLAKHLRRGHSLVLFPEGTSSEGQWLLPFKSSLFSLAELETEGRPIAVQPVALLCTELGGLPIGRAGRPYYAWFGDMTLLPHLWRVAMFGRFTVDVTFFPPVTIKNFTDRKALAKYCQKIIARGVEQGLTGRLAGDGLSVLPHKDNKRLTAS
jgi:lyso-ornithine lipid O-acyltransferase